MMERMIFPYSSESDIQKDMLDIQNIYDHIVDEKSKEIYIYRLLLTFTGDMKYIRKLILCTDIGKEYERFLSAQDKIYVYGAGIRGRRLVQIFPEMKWEKYVDENCEGTCNGLDIIKPENLKMNKDAIVLISNYEEVEEIKKNLISLGIQQDQIVSVKDFDIKAQENQYFEERCIKNFKKVSGDFLDVGCFDGRDSVKFLESALNNNALIYAFEPDNANYQECKRVLSGYSNIKIYLLGLSDSKKKETFLSGRGDSACVTNSGNCSIEVDTIDHVMRDRQIGFIKMDIEGSEKNALMGGKLHIQKDKPNMMISIYHKREDVIDIPKLLLEINQEYKFAFGHYSVGGTNETVIYVFE